MAQAAIPQKEDGKATGTYLSNFDNKSLWDEEYRRLSQRNLKATYTNPTKMEEGTPPPSKKDKSPGVSPKDQEKQNKKEKKERERVAKEKEKSLEKERKKEKKDRKSTIRSDSSPNSTREPSPPKQRPEEILARSESKDRAGESPTKEKRGGFSLFKPPKKSSTMKIVDDRPTRNSMEPTGRFLRANSTLSLSSGTSMSASDSDLTVAVGSMTMNGKALSRNQTKPPVTQVFQPDDSPPSASNAPVRLSSQKKTRSSDGSVRSSDEDLAKRFGIDDTIGNRSSRSSEDSLPNDVPASLSRRSSVGSAIEAAPTRPMMLTPRRRAISTVDLKPKMIDLPPTPSFVKPRLRRKGSLPREITTDEHSQLLRRSLRWLPNMRRGRRDIFCLPRETFLYILQFLGFDDLLKASMVCWQWNELSKEPMLWKSLFAYYESSLVKTKEKSVWDDEDVPKPDQTLQDVVTSDPNKMTLNQLVVRLTPNQVVPDAFTVGVFLAMYKTFTSTDNLVRKMLERYNVPSCPNPNPDEQEQWKKNVVNPIQLRVCRILKGLIDNHYEDLTPDVIRLLKTFAKGSLDPSGMLSTSLKSSFKKQSTLRPARSSIRPSASTSGKPGKLLNFNFDVLDEVSTKELAEQLCLLEYEFFREIKPEEWLNDKGSKQRTDEMIEHFNIVSIWVQERILSAEKCRARARRMERFIKVAIRLRELNNFETLMAVVSSLSDSAIFRLNFTKGEVSRPLMKAYEELQELMNGERGYHRYREVLKDVQCPCIPYIGVHRRDLIYHAETDQSKNEVVVDFKRKTYIYNIIKEIQRWQSVPYSFPTVPNVYEALKLLPKPAGMTTDQYKEGPLWQLSLKREPKTATKSTILW